MKVRVTGGVPALVWSSSQAIRNWWFDLRYRVDTVGGPTNRDILQAGPNADDGYGYTPIDRLFFDGAIRGLPIDHSLFSLVDYGSGKGKAVLLASGLPFRRVVGVEYSLPLNAVARRNLTRYRGAPRQTKEVHLVQADAAHFEPPPGPLVVLVCNAFREPVMRSVVRNLRSSYRRESRPIILVYLSPASAHLMEEWPEAGLVGTGWRYRIFAAGLRPSYLTAAEAAGSWIAPVPINAS